MLSKKKLFKDLDRFKQCLFKGVGSLKRGDQLAFHGIADETYGRKSMIYVTVENNEARKHLEMQLESAGHRVHGNYHPGSGILEVQVKYFKGWHWNV